MLLVAYLLIELFLMSKYTQISNKSNHFANFGQVKKLVFLVFTKLPKEKPDAQATLTF